MGPSVIVRALEPHQASWEWEITGSRSSNWSTSGVLLAGVHQECCWCTGPGRWPEWNSLENRGVASSPLQGTWGSFSSQAQWLWHCVLSYLRGEKGVWRRLVLSSVAPQAADRVTLWARGGTAQERVATLLRLRGALAATDQEADTQPPPCSTGMAILVSLIKGCPDGWWAEITGCVWRALDETKMDIWINRPSTEALPSLSTEHTIQAAKVWIKRQCPRKGLSHLLLGFLSSCALGFSVTGVFTTAFWFTGL